MKKYSIFGDIVQDGYKSCESDVSLIDFKNFLDSIGDDKYIELEICSCGGDVLQGVAISNLIKQYRSNGYFFTAHVVSIAASIASFIAASCDEIVMDSNSILMIHLPYTCGFTGNAIEMYKEIQQLDKMKDVLIDVYKTKFNLSSEEIEKLLVDETWICANEIEKYSLNCTVLTSTEPMKYAAKMIGQIKNFNNKLMIEKVLNMNKEDIKEVKEVKEESPAVVEETKEVIEEVTEEPKEEVKEAVEEIKEEKEEEKLEEIVKKLTEENTSLKQELDACKKMLDECKKEQESPVEERVSKMQSVMQNKINVQAKDFMDKLELKDKELSDMKNQVSDLTNKLETANRELSDKASALEEKQTALAQLNASVLKPNEQKNWKDLHGQEFFDYLKENKIK